MDQAETRTVQQSRSVYGLVQVPVLLMFHTVLVPHGNMSMQSLIQWLHGHLSKPVEANGLAANDAQKRCERTVCSGLRRSGWGSGWGAGGYDDSPILFPYTLGIKSAGRRETTGPLAE